MAWGRGGGRAGTADNQQFGADAGTPFGGSGNIYADFNDDTSGSGVSAQSATYSVGNAVSTFQFDFHEPSGGGNDGILFGFGTSAINSANARARASLGGGSFGLLSDAGDTDNGVTYLFDTTYTIYMVFNDTSSAVNYAGGTVAASTADIWIEDFGGGNLRLAGSAAVENSQAGSYRVAFRSFSNPQQRLYVDNVSLSEGAAAIPEPGSFALLAGMFGLTWVMLRRR